MPCKIHIDLGFALPNGEINPAFKSLWEKYVFLAGAPVNKGSYLEYTVKMTELLDISTVAALASAHANNEVYQFGCTVEMSNYKFNNNTVPSWVNNAEKLDEDGNGTGVYKKWFEWTDEAIQFVNGGNWYLPGHLFNKQISLTGKEIKKLLDASYAVKSDIEFNAIRAQYN